MAGQGMERREVLRIMAIAATAAGFPGFHRWAFACNHVGGAVQLAAGPYKPQFFTPAEYATVERLTELIIPSDGTPGAREAGVAEFIDFMTASDASIQFRYRYGLTWLDSHAERLHRRRFRELGENEQTDILRHLAYKAEYRDGENEGRDFFGLIREYTLMGFYTSKIGLQELGYPGLQLYSESPGCPHPGNPEHTNLPAPKA